MAKAERRWADHFYRSADDRLDLYARIYEGGGPTLLMMHGLTRNSADFEPLVDALDDDYRIISVDQRGRGRSAYDPEPANYVPQVYVNDMFALLDGLDIEQVTAIGTSMGGLMAVMMGAMQKDRLKGIIMNDIGPEVDASGIARIQGYVGSTDPVTTWEQAAQKSCDINGPAFPDYHKDDWMDFARRTFRQQEDGNLRLDYDPAIASSMEGEEPSTVPPDLWPVWDMLADLPILLIRGAISDILSADTAREMERRHNGSFARIDVPRIGHAPILDEPEAVAAIKSFLQDRTQ